MLGELGWQVTQEECMRHFVGKSLKEELSIIAAETGRAVDGAWLSAFQLRRNAALMEQLTPIPNIHDAVRRIHARHDARIACASGADRVKVEMQLRKVGLMDYFEGRIFSGYETPRSKPFPDVYLAAAAALQADPRRCAVVEDTVTGVAAGAAAGAIVFAYVPHGDAAPLRAAGAVEVFADMAELPQLMH
jgi:HAD superfamily hydrolase (TIGR01509 family)